MEAIFAFRSGRALPARAQCSAMDSAIASEYARRGCVRLTNLLQEGELALLRAECDVLRSSISSSDLLAADCVVDIPPAAMLPERDAARTNAAAYLAARFGDRAIGHVVLEALPAVAASCTLPVSAPPFLFNEHYVCKPERVAGEFSWHTDAAHQCEAQLALGADDEAAFEYVSAWVALDDICEDNGALVLLPRDAPQPPDASRVAPASTSTETWLDGAGHHAVTTRGMRAGDGLLFSSTLWHSSESNRSGAVRRAFYAQYSSAPLVARGSPLALAVPTQPDATRLGRVQVGPLLPAAVGDVPATETCPLQPPHAEASSAGRKRRASTVEVLDHDVRSRDPGGADARPR